MTTTPTSPTDQSDLNAPADTAGAPSARAAAHRSVTITVSGMTCTACARRIEKKLNKLPDVSATVNFATSSAAVSYPDGHNVDYFLAVIADLGFQGTLPQADLQSDAAAEPADTDDIADAAWRHRLWWTAGLGIPVIAMAMVTPWQFTHWQWLSLTLTAPIVVYGGGTFHRAAWANARQGAATMDTLVSLGTLSAFGWSVWALFFGTAGMPGMVHEFSWSISRTHGADHIYFEAAAGITLFLLAGRYFEHRSRRSAHAALTALLRVQPQQVTVIRGGIESTIPITGLVVSDVFVVRPGDRVATDGVVVEGSSEVDAAIITGESTPVPVTVDDTVVGGCVNTTGALRVRATSVGDDTQLAHIARLVTEAQNSKASVQRLADAIASVFVPIVLTIAAVTFGFWLGNGTGTQAAVTAMVAVLIIACPCALGLATPMALLVGTGVGSRLGIIVKGAAVLERIRSVKTVVLDKTGTVTTATMAVTQVECAAGTSTAELIRRAGSVEKLSEHPIASAVTAYATELGEPMLPVTDFENTAGFGVVGVVDDTTVVVGRPEFCVAQGNILAADVDEKLQQLRQAGHTVVACAWGGNVRGVIAVADSIRPSSAAAVARLRALGCEPVLLTGDNEAAARRVADQVGVDTVIADVTPEGKVDAVKQLQAEGRTVAMVGDGVNDAAALAQADLGMAMGAGADVAVEASDITLMRNDLWSAVDAIRLSRRTLRTIHGNLFWAFGYNVVAIPLAVTGMLTPMIAGAAMAFSSVFVVLNSLTLHTFRSSTPTTTNPTPAPQPPLPRR